MHSSPDGEEYIDSDEFEQFESENDIKRKNCIVQVLYQVLDCYKFTQSMYQQKNQDNQKYVFDFLEKFYNVDYSYDIATYKITLSAIKENNIQSDTDSKHIFAILESLTRFSILDYDNVENPRGYKWSGNLPSNIVDIKINSLLPQEEKFVDLFESYIQLIGDIYDLCNSRDQRLKHKEIKKEEDCTSITSINSYNDYKTNLKTYSTLKENIPGKVSIDIINNGINLFETVLDTILRKKCLAICSEIILNRINIENLKKTTISDQNSIPQLLVTTQLRKQLYGKPNYIIYKPDFSKQIIVTKDFDYNGLSDEVKKQIDEQSQTLYIINIITDNALNKPLTYEKTSIGKRDKEIKEIISVEKNYFKYIYDENYWSIIPILQKLTESL